MLEIHEECSEEESGEELEEGEEKVCKKVEIFRKILMLSTRGGYTLPLMNLPHESSILAK